MNAVSHEAGWLKSKPTTTCLPGWMQSDTGSPVLQAFSTDPYTCENVSNSWKTELKAQFDDKKNEIHLQLLS